MNNEELILYRLDELAKKVECLQSDMKGQSIEMAEVKTLILNNLEQDIYEIQIYDITVWKNNDNFWFTNVAINVNSLTYMVDEKVEEYNGIYQIFIK